MIYTGIDYHKRYSVAAKLESRTEETPPPPTKRGKQPDAAVRTLLFQKFGVDVTAVDGVNTHVGFTFLTEIGPDLSGSSVID